uniref:Bestrophin homolog n=1 Tax=Heterorhabditis bacteriophora TaxID=37862 RepID=A0A1I7WEH6_HETBA
MSSILENVLYWTWILLDKRSVFSIAIAVTSTYVIYKSSGYWNAIDLRLVVS